MKNLIIASILIAVSAVQAGTIKLPGSNITRNAGTSIPVTIQASGFPAGSTATISLIHAKTWVVTPWLLDVPVVNGNNLIEVPIWWSSPEIGTRLVKVQIGNNHCTSTWTVRLRSAIIWPYQGTAFEPDQEAWVTWTTGGNPLFDARADFLEAHLITDDGPELYVLADAVSPADGRLLWEVPDVTPGSNYRIRLLGWAYIMDIYGEFELQLVDVTVSERIVIR